MRGNGAVVADGVHRLTNGVSNFYLIEENGKLVLVDAGEPWTGGLADAISRAKTAGTS
jgi:hypothetical protein